MTRVLASLILIAMGLSGGPAAAGSPGTPSETTKGVKLTNAALLLIDIQNDYFPGGKMELEGSFQASSCAQRLLSFFREGKIPVVHIQHISVRPGATFFLPGTEGVKIHPSVAPSPDEIIIQKNYPNSFRDTPLFEYLKKAGVTHVVICGMMTQMCVDATTRAAFDHGLQCTVVSDACAARAVTFGDKVIPVEHVHGAFLAALSAVYARVVTTEGFISNNPWVFSFIQG
jgi:nicotinamidase-related amidase